MTKANHPRSKTETRRLLEEWPAKLELVIVVLYSRRQCPGIPSRLFLSYAEVKVKRGGSISGPRTK
jgi:hypothetical protein